MIFKNYITETLDGLSWNERERIKKASFEDLKQHLKNTPNLSKKVKDAIKYQIEKKSKTPDMKNVIKWALNDK